MTELKNNILEKLASEGRISFIPEDETYEIQRKTTEKMTQYKRLLSKREYYSHVAAGKVILNS
jgi:hypothetical protein